VHSKGLPSPFSAYDGLLDETSSLRCIRFVLEAESRRIPFAEDVSDQKAQIDVGLS
jgi:hypothetical protein